MDELFESIASNELNIHLQVARRRHLVEEGCSFSFLSFLNEFVSFEDGIEGAARKREVMIFT